MFRQQKVCGICGYVGDLTPGHLEAMCRAMAHRGPDDHGIYHSPESQIGLGHRRLSILDLSSAGHQPMCNEDESVWITFNGEIYNFRDLRKDLIARGYRFKSATDTEVIIHLYEEYGESFLDQLNGMFALAIWDHRKNELLIARDRVGIKPLYFVAGSRFFVFASEIKAFFMAGLLTNRIDPLGIQEYLACKYISGDRTVFHDVRKLEPGKWIKVDRCGGFQKGVFWEYFRQPDVPPRAKTEYVGELRHVVEQSISDQMVADVPVGAFLSGGIDSSIVVTEMARVSGARVKCFTVEYEEGQTSFNESTFAALTSKHAGAEHTLARCSIEQGVSLLPYLIYMMDEPVSEPLMVSSFLLSQTARKDVTVVLAGEGADETFAGYRRYKFGYYAGLLTFLPSRIRSAALRLSEKLRGVQSFPYQVLSVSLSPESVAGANLAFMPNEISALMTQDLSDYVSPVFSGDLSPRAILEFLIEVDFRRRLPEYILTRADKMSMAHSLEMRVPLLDNRIVDLAMRLPWDLKLSGTTDKYLLRRAFSRQLPRKIVKRPKMPFQAPYERWLPRLSQEYLIDSQLVSAGVINAQELARLREHKNDFRRNDKLFSILVLELWFRIFITQSLNFECLTQDQHRGIT